MVNHYPKEAEMESWQGKAQSISISLPPSGITVWKLKEHPDVSNSNYSENNIKEEKKKKAPKGLSDGK
ncbi:hypothetical protein D3C85_1602140 [compost metagenome]